MRSTRSRVKGRQPVKPGIRKNKNAIFNETSGLCTSLINSLLVSETSNSQSRTAKELEFCWSLIDQFVTDAVIPSLDTFELLDKTKEVKFTMHDKETNIPSSSNYIEVENRPNNLASFEKSNEDLESLRLNTPLAKRKASMRDSDTQSPIVVLDKDSVFDLEDNAETKKETENESVEFVDIPISMPSSIRKESRLSNNPQSFSPTIFDTLPLALQNTDINSQNTEDSGYINSIKYEKEDTKNKNNENINIDEAESNKILVKEILSEKDITVEEENNVTKDKTHMLNYLSEAMKSNDNYKSILEKMRKQNISSDNLSEKSITNKELNKTPIKHSKFNSILSPSTSINRVNDDGDVSMELDFENESENIKHRSSFALMESPINKNDYKIDIDDVTISDEKREFSEKVPYGIRGTQALLKSKGVLNASQFARVVMAGSQQSEYRPDFEEDDDEGEDMEISETVDQSSMDYNDSVLDKIDFDNLTRIENKVKEETENIDDGRRSSISIISESWPAKALIGGIRSIKEFAGNVIQRQRESWGSSSEHDILNKKEITDNKKSITPKTVTDSENTTVLSFSNKNISAALNYAEQRVASSGKKANNTNEIKSDLKKIPSEGVKVFVTPSKFNNNRLVEKKDRLTSSSQSHLPLIVSKSILDGSNGGGPIRRTPGKYASSLRVNNSTLSKPQLSKVMDDDIPSQRVGKTDLSTLHNGRGNLLFKPITASKPLKSGLGLKSLSSLKSDAEKNKLGKQLTHNKITIDQHNNGLRNNISSHREDFIYKKPHMKDKSSNLISPAKTKLTLQDRLRNAANAHKELHSNRTSKVKDLVSKSNVSDKESGLSSALPTKFAHINNKKSHIQKTPISLKEKSTIVDEYGNLPEPPSDYDSDEYGNSLNITPVKQLSKNYGTESFSILQNINGHSTSSSSSSFNMESSSKKKKKSKKNEFKPDWANTPNLIRLLKQQKYVDPDRIFDNGVMPPLEEAFKENLRAGKTFKARKSSMWTGEDRLTEEEILEYKRELRYI